MRRRPQAVAARAPSSVRAWAPLSPPGRREAVLETDLIPGYFLSFPAMAQAGIDVPNRPKPDIFACRSVRFRLMYPSSIPAIAYTPDSGEFYDSHFGRRRPSNRPGRAEKPVVRV